MQLLPVLFLLAAVDFPPLSEATPNRQPHLAAAGRTVALTYGAGNAVYASVSKDGGTSWTKPVLVSKPGRLSLGARRGPRIAIAGSTLVIAAIAGEKGGGADGDVMTWRSTDGGATWSTGKVINDVPASAREGLHALAAGPNGRLFAAWLDLRQKGTRIYGAASDDAGVTWSANRLVYESPGGSVCECCHPSVQIDSKGRVFVMFRNLIDGDRDMYVVRSDDGGATFGTAQKLGSGSWQLNACPMDGGNFTVDDQGNVTAVWRREATVYSSGIGGTEAPLGPGKQPVVIATSRGTVFAWTDTTGTGKSLKWLRAPGGPAKTLPRDATFVSLVALPGGQVLASAEESGTVFITTLK